MPLLHEFPWLHAAISERSHGNLRIGEETPAKVRAERETLRCEFLDKQGISGPLFTPYLAHGGKVAVVSDVPREDLEKISESHALREKTLRAIYIPDADGLLTNAAGIVLGVTVADCAPVLVVDPIKKAIAAVHAGWRGLASGIIENTIVNLAEVFGSKPQDLRAFIGPAIGPCHFEVKRDVFKIFPPEVRRRTAAGLFVDLPGACRGALIFAGLEEKNINLDGRCTFCEQDRFFSYRRDRPQEISAMLAVIAIKK